MITKRRHFRLFEREQLPLRPISVVPLIDIIFMLMVFFVLAGTIERFDVVPVDVPFAESGKLLEDGHVFVLLGSHEEVIVNDEMMALEQLTPALSVLLKDNPERVITLKADSRLPAKRMIDVMNMIKAAGGRNLSLVTQRM